MKVVKQGLSVALSLALALAMVPASAFAVGSESSSGVTTETLHPFTGTDDLIRSAYEELSGLGVEQEAKVQDEAHVAKVESASGMTYDQATSFVYTQIMDGLEAGTADISALNLDESDMSALMDQVLYEYYLYNAISDLEYTVDAGKVVAVAFTLSEGFASAMVAMDEEYVASVPEEVVANAAEEASFPAVDAAENATDVQVVAENEDAEAISEVDDNEPAVAAEAVHGTVAIAQAPDGSMYPDINFKWSTAFDYTPIFDANGDVANGGLIYDAASGEIVTGILPSLYGELVEVSFTCAHCGETVTVTEADSPEMWAQFDQGSYEIYYDLTNGQITQVPSSESQPATSDTFIHYTQMQVAAYFDATFSIDPATGYPVMDANGNPIGMYSGTFDNGQAEVEYYYAQLSAFNADYAEYFGVSTDYWTSKNTEANPMAALKTLCNLDPEMQIPPAQMIQMVQMLPQAFMAYVYYYGNELLVMRDACVEAVKALPANATDVQKMLVIHDWLAENAVFDMGSMLNVAGESSGNDPIQMTTFGALLSNQLTTMTNSSYYGGICLAYAAGYTYLVQAAYPEIYTDGKGNWLKPAQVDAKGGDIVDFSQVMFYADTAETSIAGEGFGGDLFNNVHYFNAVKISDAPTSNNADDAMMGNWFYVDSCYDDIYIECLAQYRAEAEGSVYHTYFLVSPQSMAKLWADAIDYIDSPYDGYTYVPQVDANGNVTTPSDNVSADHPDYDPTHPEYVKTENPRETKNDNTCYEESWFSGAVSKIYNDGKNWYYVDNGSSISSQSGMLNDNGEFDIDTGQMEQNGLNLDGLMHSNRVGVESQDVMKQRSISSPDYWPDEDNNNNNFGFDMTTKEDTYATVLFDYGTGKFSTNEEIDLSAAVVEDFVYNEQYPGLTHSIGLYNGIIYFNLGNQIYAYDVANATCELFKEYNTVSANSDGRPFTASSYTMDAEGTALTVENNPIAALCVRTAYTPLYNYVDANGNVVIDYMGNVKGDPSAIVGQVFQMMYAAPTMTVNIGTNYTFTYPSAGSGYSAEAINYNPDYNMGMSDEGVNKNDEFLWCANIREDVPMDSWVASEPGEDAVPCSAQISGHAYVYNAEEDVYICSECNLHAVNIAEESEFGVVTMTSIPESGMSDSFVGNNGGSTTTEPVSPEREAATVQSGEIVIAVKPVEGYGVNELSYCYEGGESVVVTPSEDGTYVIAKEEAGCITVSVEYKEIQYLEGLTVKIAEATYTGEEQQPSLTITDEDVALVEGEDYAVTSAPQTNAGTYELVVVGLGEYEGEYRSEWTIAPADIASVEGLTVENQTYTGDPIEPALALSFNEIALVEGTDYAVDYSDNVTPGKATIAVTGMGNFEGTVDVTFEVLSIKIDAPSGTSDLIYSGSEQIGVAEGEGYVLSGVVSATNAGMYIAIATLKTGYAWSDGSTGRYEIEWEIESADIASAEAIQIPAQPWTGSAIEPEVTLTFNGATLVEGEDYLLVYSGNVDPGMATITLTGIGSFTGEADISFRILEKAHWESAPSGWRYVNADGSYSADCWQEIDGVRYHFGADSYMDTGWVFDGGEWYYLKSSGAMAASEWAYYGGEWYYLKSSGAMATGWLLDGGEWYYLYDSGVMAASEWVYYGGSWYYLKGSGIMAASEWVYYGGSWYYMYGTGSMATGWIYDGGSWYYLYSSGKMASNCWIGDYYLLSDGRMATNQWIGGYYVGADGKWVSR